MLNMLKKWLKNRTSGQSYNEPGNYCQKALNVVLESNECQRKH